MLVHSLDIKLVFMHTHGIARGSAPRGILMERLLCDFKGVRSDESLSEILVHDL